MLSALFVSLMVLGGAPRWQEVYRENHERNGAKKFIVEADVGRNEGVQFGKMRVPVRTTSYDPAGNKGVTVSDEIGVDCDKRETSGMWGLSLYKGAKERIVEVVCGPKDAGK